MNVPNGAPMSRLAVKWTAAWSASLLLVTASLGRAADKGTIVWKQIPDAILQVDGKAPKIWNLWRAGKKDDPMLLQLGSRSFVIYIRSKEVYEIKPDQLARKGEDLLWRETDKPDKPLATTDWNTKDIGSASRVQLKFADEGRLIDIQIPQVPDYRRGIY